MKRKIVSIDEDLCNGCGLCVSACHEGALVMVNGKAKLVSDIYCDGLGDCLPGCPTGAIKIEERVAEPFDEEAVKAKVSAKAPLPCGCPGSMARSISRSSEATTKASPVPMQSEATSALSNWPVQIKLVPVAAPYLNNSKLLVAADCTAFAYPEIHSRFMKGRVTLIGCPKLDEGDYAEKLAAILSQNEISSVTVLRMEVPCCAGITNAVKRALVNSGKMIPWNVVTISTEGEILEE